MTVFKTYLRVLRRCLAPVLMYSVFLIVFGAFNMQTSESSMSFTAERPDVYLVDHDGSELSQAIVAYMADHCTMIDLSSEGDAVTDALFYRDVNYVIEIPENYGADFLAEKETQITVKSTGDYQSSYAQMLLSQYIKVARTYLSYTESESELVELVSEVLANTASVEMTTTLDKGTLNKAAFYYNFASYAILAVCIYVICLILSSFREKKIRRRTVVSSVREGRYNLQLLVSNGLFAFLMWGVYVLLSIALIGQGMLNSYGLIYMINSLVFTFCALTVALFIGNLVSNKNAINGIVNVVALGSSFLCGAFVPVEWLPEPVLAVAHILPAYWYIQTNETLKTIEHVTADTIRPIVVNMAVVLLFSLVFIVATQIVSRKKRKIG